jgi:hypothetical protein
VRQGESEESRKKREGRREVEKTVHYWKTFMYTQAFTSKRIISRIIFHLKLYKKYILMWLHTYMSQFFINPAIDCP